MRNHPTESTTNRLEVNIGSNETTASTWHFDNFKLPGQDFSGIPVNTDVHNTFEGFIHVCLVMYESSPPHLYIKDDSNSPYLPYIKIFKGDLSN